MELILVSGRDGGLTYASCYKLCQKWAEEEEWNGRDSSVWRKRMTLYKDARGVAHDPVIEARLTNETIVPWERRHEVPQMS